MKKFYTLSLLLFIAYNISAQVGIGTTTPDPSSVLDVSASDKGMLVPRVALANIVDTSLDGVNTAAEGLLIYNTNASVAGGSGVGFYIFNGTSWSKLMTTSDVNEDADFYEEGGTSAPNAITDNMYTQGNVAIGKTTADYALDIMSSGNRGIQLTTNSAASSSQYGLYNLVNTTTNGARFAVYNDMQATGSNFRVGSYSLLRNNESISVGSYNILSNTGNGSQWGAISDISGDSNGDVYAFSSVTSNSGNGMHHGTRIVQSGSGSGVHFGNYVAQQGNPTGAQYGSFYRNQVNNASGTQYGVYANLRGTGSNTKYGLYVDIPTSANGTQYGLYSDVQKSGGYAGYFIGDVRMENLGGSGNQIVVVDNDGDLSTQALPGDDADFFEVGGTSAPDAITDDMYTQGNVAIGKTTADYALDIETAGERGVSNHMNSTGSSIQNGVYNLFDAATTGARFGVNNQMTASGSNFRVGVQNTIQNNTGSYALGTSTSLNNSGTTQQWGEQLILLGNASGVQYGTFANINNSGNGDHYGERFLMGGSGSGTHYGNHTAMSAGSGTHYGSYHLLSSTGGGDKYGYYSRILSSAGGTHYGIYADVQKAGSFAGYFIGDVRMENLGGSGNQIVVVDNDGDLSTQAFPGDDADFFEVGGTSAPDAITDDMYTQGNVAIGKTTADYTLDIQSEEARGVSIDMNSNSTAANTGVYVRNTSPNTTNLKGASIFLDADTPSQIGIETSLRGTTSASAYMVGLSQTLITSGNAIGTSQNITSNSTTGGTIDGISLSMLSSSGTIRGENTVITTNGTAGVLGSQLELRGNTTQNQIADYVRYNQNSGTGNLYGYFLQNNGSGSGSHYGVNLLMNSTGNGSQYGVQANLGGTGTGNKYGLNAYANPSSGGTHYGVYSNVQKVGSFAGYFIGDVRMQSLGGSGDQMVVVNNSGDLGVQALPVALPIGGNNSDILSTDGSGNYSWVADAVDDADADPANEIELPSGGNSGDVLSTDGSGNYTWVADANDADVDWYEVGTTTAPNAITDIIYTQGQVVVGGTAANQSAQLQIDEETGNGALHMNINSADRSAVTMRRTLNTNDQGIAFQNSGNSHGATLYHTSTSASDGLSNGLTIATIGNQANAANLGETATFKDDGTVRLHDYGIGNNEDAAPVYLLGLQVDGDLVEYDNSVEAVSGPTFSSGWQDYSVANGNDYEDARYYIRDSRVYLAGLIRKTSAISNGETMITLPAGYRPLKRRIFNMQSEFGAVRIDVQANGQVQFFGGNQSGGQNWVALDGVSYRID